MAKAMGHGHGQGPRAMSKGHGPWAMGHGAWAIGHGLWPRAMVYGWAMAKSISGH